ncbi:thiol-disulfide oxidoreductase DCC family protein [Litorimonas sp. RW-G-Af-16]|uniref:thiol-disulfide oxidoreductase DCC family protein n=1 Tax=Litorimonas sp. RW-G-Af-16 TaxID=3241168 RepID=UPI00390C7373
MPIEIDPSIPPTYVYDGECVLCSRAVRYSIKHDSGDPPVRFVAIKSSLGRSIAKHNDVDPDDPHTFIYVEDGQSHVLTDAVFALSKRVGGPGKWINIFWIVPRPIRDWVYLRLALNRYQLFGKLDTCYSPNAEHRDRFILE